MVDLDQLDRAAASPRPDRLDDVPALGELVAGRLGNAVLGPHDRRQREVDGSVPGKLNQRGASTASCGESPWSITSETTWALHWVCWSPPGVPPTSHGCPSRQTRKALSVCMVRRPGARTFGWPSSSEKPRPARLLSVMPVSPATTPEPNAAERLWMNETALPSPVDDGEVARVGRVLGDERALGEPRSAGSISARRRAACSFADELLERPPDERRVARHGGCDPRRRASSPRRGDGSGRRRAGRARPSRSPPGC